MVETLYQEFHSKYGIEGINISLLDPSGKYMTPYKLYNPCLNQEILNHIYQISIPLNINGGMSAFAVQKKEAVFVKEFRQEHLFSNLGKKINSILDIKSNIYYPIMSANQAIGLITLPSYSKNIELTPDQLKEIISRLQFITLSVITYYSFFKFQTLLKQKDLLLKEVHHRINHNLQLISSILNLQIFQMNQNNPEETLKSAERRIISISRLHQKLSRQSVMNIFDFRSHIRELLDYLSLLFTNPHQDIQIKSGIEEMSPDLDTAFSLSLIINELVSNSFKHAFKEMNKGLIEVAIFRQTEELYVLSVKDNGSGFPANYDIKKPNTLGLELVTGLAESLNGKINLSCDKGTQITLQFYQKDIF